MGFTPQTIPQLKTTIGWGLPENDTIPARLDRIVEAIEKTCQPVIQELAGMRDLLVASTTSVPELVGAAGEWSGL
jgi:hypothetical protein